MAKRQVIGHTKLKKLARKLNIPSYAALGILESLWHLTMREAPQGDIGKLSDEDIAVGIDWDGEDSALINALVECRWIDVSEEHRLVIHDWHEHADNSTKKNLSRNGQEFVTHGVESTDMPEDVQTCPDKKSLPKPIPTLHITKPTHNQDPPETPPSADRDERKTIFRKPTVIEVQEYMTTRGFPNPLLIAENFVNHYQTKGWKVGGDPMKDWKACVRTWEARMRAKGEWVKPPPKQENIEVNYWDPDRPMVMGIDYRTLGGVNYEMKRRVVFDEDAHRAMLRRGEGVGV